MELSNLGIFHTVIGVLAIIAAVVEFIKHGKIALHSVSGKIYFYGTLITSLTALGLSSVSGFNPGHGLALIIVLLIVGSYYLHTKKQGHNRFRFVENFFLSFSFFLSMIPTVNETLTRVPVGHPIAKGPTDPLIARTLGIVLLLFVTGSIYQFIKQRKLNAVAKQRAFSA
jgi:hypothetical protein